MRADVIMEVCSWFTLIGSVIWVVVLMLRKPRSDWPPKFVAQQVICSVALILLAIGMLVRTDEWVFGALLLMSMVLLILIVHAPYPLSTQVGMCHTPMKKEYPSAISSKWGMRMHALPGTSR